MVIIPKTYRWAHPLVHRIGAPNGCVLHHSASSTASPDDIHRWHLNAGYSGIGYHFIVRKSGKVYQGRPLWAMGGHTLGHNDWVGICAEGNFENETMPKAQLRALQGLVDYLKKKYPGIVFKRHRDMPGNATACPGRKYPFALVKKGMPPFTGRVFKVPEPTHKPVWWKNLLTYLKRSKKV